MALGALDISAIALVVRTASHTCGSMNDHMKSSISIRKTTGNTHHRLFAAIMKMSPR